MRRSWANYLLCAATLLAAGGCATKPTDLTAWNLFSTRTPAAQTLPSQQEAPAAPVAAPAEGHHVRYASHISDRPAPVRKAGRSCNTFG